MGAKAPFPGSGTSSLRCPTHAVVRLKQRTPATYVRGGGEYDMDSYKRIVLPHILAGIGETA
ncbi:hypothetical protein M7M4_16770 [Corynebacterium pseudogenitalium]